MQRYLVFVALLFVLGMAPAAQADGTIAKLAAKLKVDPADISPAPLPGLYRVIMGPQVTYVSADGRYLVRGDIIDIKDGKDLTREQREAARMAYISRIAASDMIVFKAPHARHVLTVLTDIDCQYCRALAREMPQLAAQGVELHYLAFPRAGVGSSSWDKAVAVWCAKDRQTAYQDAMRGSEITGGKCDESAVAAGYDFAQRLGLQGTPAIITETGQLIDGYLPVPDLVRLLDDPSLQAQMDD
ncbi:MAG TPA: DsbC family protein [Gammaproteobacteria bacterium]|jgi:thiol:disulfide interchange protein DsbC|nr:DsbC family protein [Gammaproteobacteria bacterium]